MPEFRRVRPRRSRLAGCTVVHRALWTAGFPCPEPLVDLQPLDGYAATAETLVPDVGEPPPGSELAALSAAALACQAGPGRGPAGRLTRRKAALPEDRDVDLNAHPEPWWLARVAAAVRDQLRGHADDPVIGHGD